MFQSHTAAQHHSRFQDINEMVVVLILSPSPSFTNPLIILVMSQKYLPCFWQLETLPFVLMILSNMSLLSVEHIQFCCC